MSWIDLCIPLIKASEGCKLTAYPDPGTGASPWTCGWGSTGPDVHNGTVWTQAQADARLVQDVARFGTSVDQLIKVPLKDNQHAALVDFAYNVGSANLARSSLLKYVNASRLDLATAEFAKWNLANGKVLNGLVKRRQREADLFSKGVWS